MKKIFSVYFIYLFIFVVLFSFTMNQNVSAATYSDYNLVPVGDRTYVDYPSLTDMYINGQDLSLGGMTYEWFVDGSYDMFGFEVYGVEGTTIQGLYDTINYTNQEIGTGIFTLETDGFYGFTLKKDNVTLFTYTPDEEDPVNPFIYDTAYYKFYYVNYQEVLPDQTPVLNGETAFVTNVDSPYTVTEIQSHLTAIDDVDGDITNQIVVEEDNYTTYMNTIGDYTIVFSVTDSAGNKATLTVNVLVRDISEPVLAGQSEYTQSMSNLLDVNTIKSALTVTDNCDNGLPIVIESDNYTPNYDRTGVYAITFKATDNSGNVGTYVVNVTVVDDINPTISGPTTIVKNNTEVLTVSEVKAQLTANDNKDGIITENIVVKTDNYTGNGHITGDYTIVFEVQDSSGNKTTHTTTISVMDNIPPVFYTDNYYISVSQSISLTLQDIIDILTATGQIEVTTQTYITTLSNEYEGNETKVGVYAVSLEVKDQSGNEEIINSAIKVLQDNTNDVELEPEDTSIVWYQYIWNVFVWIWELIVKIFNWIINLF